jgi:MFS family permease
LGIGTDILYQFCAAGKIKSLGLFSLFTLSLLLFRPLIGVALDRYGRRWFLLIALILYSISYAGYGLAGSIEWMYAARLLQGLGAALLLLTVDAINTDLALKEERANAMGQNVEAQTRSTFVGAAIGFTLVGLLPSKLGAVVDRYGAVWPSTAGMLAIAALYFILPEFDSFWFVVGVYTLSAVGWAVIEPARKSMTAVLSGSEVAKGFGLAEMCFGLGAVVGPLAGGYLYDHYNHAVPFYLNGIMMLVAAILLILLVRPKLKHS